MKTVHFKLSGVVERLTIEVVDVLGKEWKFCRKGQIRISFWSTQDCYGVHNPDFESIKNYALKDGIHVEADRHVNVARINLLSTEEIPEEIVIGCKYGWFKPTIQYNHTTLKCEEVKQ